MKMRKKNREKKTETANKSSFAVIEAYNSIRTNLLFLLKQHSGNIVTISSPDVSEGKSTTALNIAVSLSQLGNKILLIDADLRRPSIHKKTHLQNTSGLSDVLVGFSEFENAVNKVSPTLDVLLSGSTPPNPSELLSNDSFAELLNLVSEKYDYVIIDTPPINIVSDALVVAPKTTGVVVVIREGITSHEDFKGSIAGIEFADITLLGVVINDTDYAKTKYRSRYKNRYKYRYGYKYGSRYYAN